MSYIPAPFNPTNRRYGQVVDELNQANENFTILSQAFLNNDPSSQPILRATYTGSTAPSNPVAGTTWLDTSSTPTLKVYDGSDWQVASSGGSGTSSNADTVDGFHASQTPAPNTIPASDNTGKIDKAWLDIFKVVPYWKVSVDTTSGSRTSPVGFTKSFEYKYMSYGSVMFYFYNFSSWSFLWEMKVISPSNLSVVGRMVFMDDNSYVYLNNTQVASITSAGVKNATFTLNLTQGENLIQIVLNNSGGSATGMFLALDFDWNSLRFVPL